MLNLNKIDLVELIKSFIEASRERLKNPISGAFLWSFLIWNWRPILLLLFSKESIEVKTSIINNEYVSATAVLGPLLMALVYTVGIPRLMLGIDNLLAPTKEGRTKNFYRRKEDVIDAKIEIAQKVARLSYIESGNKDREELLDQIDDLKRTVENVQISLKNEKHVRNQLESQNSEFNIKVLSLTDTVNDFNNKVQSLRQENVKTNEQLSIERNKNESLTKRLEMYMDPISDILRVFNEHELDWIKYLKEDESLEATFNEEFPPSIVGKLENNRYIKTSANGYVLTDRGIDLLYRLKRYYYIRENY